MFQVTHDETPEIQHAEDRGGAGARWGCHVQKPQMDVDSRFSFPFIGYHYFWMPVPLLQHGGHKSLGKDLGSCQLRHNGPHLLGSLRDSQEKLHQIN